MALNNGSIFTNNRLEKNLRYMWEILIFIIVHPQSHQHCYYVDAIVKVCDYKNVKLVASIATQNCIVGASED